MDEEAYSKKMSEEDMDAYLSLALCSSDKEINEALAKASLEDK